MLGKSSKGRGDGLSPIDNVNVNIAKDCNAEQETSSIQVNKIPFDPHLLPKVVKDHVIDVAERMNHAPISFAGVVALTVLSSAIGRRVGVRPKLYDDWTVIPNLWGAIIAPPSIKKSPITAALFKPLKKAETLANEQFNKEMKIYKVDESNYKAEIKKYQQSLGNGAKVAMPTKIDKPTRKRYIVNDATVEKVADIMIDNPNGLVLFNDELNEWLSNLSKSGREGDRAFWIDAWNGNSSKNVDRISRGSTHVPYVCASIFGTIQPDVISKLILSTKKGTSGGDGLLQRFQLMTIATETKMIYTDRKPNHVAQEGYSNLIYKILSTNPTDLSAQKEQGDDMLFYRFSEGANTVFKNWCIELNKKIVLETEHNPALAAHFGKYEGLFASLALILFFSDKILGTTTVDKIPQQYAEKAKELCSFFESEARFIYNIEQLGEQKKAAINEKIIKKVKELESSKKLPMAYWEISQCVRGANTSDCEKALKGIVIEKHKKVYRLITI